MDSILQFLLSNALVATILALVLVLVGRVWRHPGLLHMLWLIVLVKLVTPPVVTVPIHWASDTVADVQPISSERALVEIAPPDEATMPTHEPTTFPEGPGREFVADATTSVVANETPRRTSALDATMMRVRTMPWKGWLVLVWLTGSVICFVVIAYRIVAFQRLLKKAAPAEKPVKQEARELGSLLGLKKSPLILMLPGRISPVVWQLARRVTIVLPEELYGRLDYKSRQTVLTHELAHIGRKDHWVRLLEVVVTLLFWWNPVLWWARRCLHELEEQCCDAEVLRVLPNSARSYANALVDTVEFLRETRVILPAAATGARPKILLKRRIEMVVQGKSIARLSLLHSTVVVFVALAVLPLAMIVQADEQPADQGSPGVTLSAPDNTAKPAKEEPANDEPKTKEAGQDGEGSSERPLDPAYLKLLQGRWERYVRGERAIKETLIIEGDQEIYIREWADGSVRYHTISKIELVSEGDVRIYKRTVTEYVKKTVSLSKFPEKQAFVFHVKGDVFYEISGLLHGHESLRRDFRVRPWRRTSSSPSEPPVFDQTNAYVESPYSGDWTPEDEDLVKDLEMLQGRWQRLTHNDAGEVTMSQEKYVEGNMETMTNFSDKGDVTRKWGARFRLEKHGPVRIIQFYEIISLTGRNAGRTHATNFSYVYHVDEKVFLDCPGLFISRRSYHHPDPAIYVWKRMDEKEAESGGEDASASVRPLKGYLNLTAMVDPSEIITEEEERADGHLLRETP